MSVRRFDKYSVMVRGVAAGLCCVLAAPGEALLFAQATATQTAKPAAGDAAPAVKLNGDQLDSLVAPIALYPDPLLSQALVASTYPLELVQAQQWLEKNKALTGDALSTAVEKQSWDPSVQATVVVPDLLKRLTEDITWTHSLGNAFLEQQDDVMDAVQRLRSKAKAAGKLDTTEQQKVETKVVETKTVIEIQPTSTQVVYVPVYSPTVIWGPPLYYPYPPMYYPPYSPGAAWVGFGVGIMVGIGISGGWGYGCGWGGGGNNIYINNNNNFHRTNNIRTGNINAGNNWNHNPTHRGGAPYSNRSTATKYGGNTRGSGQAASRAGGAGTASANRAGGASTQSANRAGASSAASSRPSGGGDKVGSRSVPQTSTRSGSSGFSGASGGASGASRASGASSRGGSSMGSRGGGGGRRR